MRRRSKIRERLGSDDWCVSVFEDNAGVVRFDDEFNLAFKVETHNHPSALEPYGGANTGVGGVIRDIMGTGLGAKPIASTDVFCFAPPDWSKSKSQESRPERRLGTRLVDSRRLTLAAGRASSAAGDARRRRRRARLRQPDGNSDGERGRVFRRAVSGQSARVLRQRWACCRATSRTSRREPGDLIVTVGGRTGRDGIHGATFSSAELTSQSEQLSGGAVQIGNAIEEKKVLDVLLAARDRGLYHAVTDCGAGGFSSAVGEMGEKIGAEVHLDRAPLKYEGLSYTEIWISEAQERMVLAVPEDRWPELEAAVPIGERRGDGDRAVRADGAAAAFLRRASGSPIWTCEFLHKGRPPVVRQAVYEAGDESRVESRRPRPTVAALRKRDYTDDLLRDPGVAERGQQGMDRAAVRS